MCLDVCIRPYTLSLCFPSKWAIVSQLNGNDIFTTICSVIKTSGHCTMTLRIHFLWLFKIMISPESSNMLPLRSSSLVSLNIAHLEKISLASWNWCYATSCPAPLVVLLCALQRWGAVNICSFFNTGNMLIMITCFHRIPTMFTEKVLRFPHQDSPRISDDASSSL